MSFCYFASPYTHKQKGVEHQRAALSCRVAGDLMAQGYIVYSPIAHGHNIAEYSVNLHTFGHADWMAQCQPFMTCADTFIFLVTEGWLQSNGVRLEYIYATKTGKTIWFCDISAKILESEQEQKAKALADASFTN